MTTSPGGGGSRSSSSRDPTRGAQPCDPMVVGMIAHCCDSKLEGRRCRTQHPRSAELRVRCRGRLRVSMRLRLDTLAPGSNELVNVDVPNHWLSISRQGVASYQHSHEYHMNLNIAHDATEPGQDKAHEKREWRRPRPQAQTNSSQSSMSRQVRATPGAAPSAPSRRPAMCFLWFFVVCWFCELSKTSLLQQGISRVITEGTP